MTSKAGLYFGFYIIIRSTGPCPLPPVAPILEKGLSHSELCFFLWDHKQILALLVTTLMD